MVPLVTSDRRRSVHGPLRLRVACGCDVGYISLCCPMRRRPGRLPEWPKGAVCKTVGSAYVGSNPTPATTCENGPLAADSRLCGPFVLCPAVCHLVTPRATMSRCPRTYSGRRPCARTVSAPSAVLRTATDERRERPIPSGRALPAGQSLLRFPAKQAARGRRGCSADRTAARPGRRPTWTPTWATRPRSWPRRRTPSTSASPSPCCSSPSCTSYRIPTTRTAS
jgi:hypothetical protein